MQKQNKIHTFSQPQVGEEQEEDDYYDSEDGSYTESEGSEGSEGSGSYYGSDEGYDEYYEGEDERLEDEYIEEDEEQGQHEGNEDEIKEQELTILEKLKKLSKKGQDDDDNFKDDIGDEYEPQELREKVVEEVTKLMLSEVDKNLNDALDILGGYIKAFEPHAQINLLRADVHLKQKNFIQGLHDVYEANKLDQVRKCPKSCKVHYVISKSLMRLSNDV